MNRNRSEPPTWRGSRQGPWPQMAVEGCLERAETEWLHTNGAGGYAMSTVALMHTRRYHGILVAALDPPGQRYVVLSHAELTVQHRGRTYRLSTHQFPNVAPTPGYRSLSKFALDPIPRWTFRLGKEDLEYRLCLLRGQNVAVLRYAWHGRSPVRLTVRPLLPLRPIHDLMREHGAMVQRAILRAGEVEIQPMPDLPPIIFGHEAVFVGSPDWWRRFEYLSDRHRAGEFQEDLWTPGTFELTLDPGATTHIVAGVGALPQGSPEGLMQDTVDYLLEQDPGPGQRSSVRTLSVAAECFCADATERPGVLAGYPWYGVHLRDQLMALPGLYLSRGRVEAAQRLVDRTLEWLRGGLLPQVILGPNAPRAEPIVDASLWLFEAGRQLLAHTGVNDPFVRERLYPALRRVFVRMRARRYHGRLVWLTDEGLVAQGNTTRPLTWMDSTVGSGAAVKARQGLAIEHQALWSRGCETLARLALEIGEAATAKQAREDCERARQGFRTRFWCNETGYPFDCVSVASDSADAWADASIRPNAVIAAAVDPMLFERWQVEAIVDRARVDLLTPHGLRSLAANDPRFRGHDDPTAPDREACYHQGSVWPHLLGFWVRASLPLLQDAQRDELSSLLEAIVDEGVVLGHVPQLADGEWPYRWGGSPSYATATAELLRALKELAG